MSAFDLSSPAAVSSKVSAYIQHLTDKKSVGSTTTTTLRSSYTLSALDRRRRRAARLRSRSGQPSSKTLDPTAPSVPFDEPSYVSSSSESSGDDRAAPKPSVVANDPRSSMDNQSVVSALSEDHHPSYPMQVTSKAAAAWVSQTNDPTHDENALLNEGYHLSGNNFVDALIAESSQRWKSVREEVVGNTTTGKLLRQRSDGAETAMALQTDLFSSLTLMPNVDEVNEETGHQFFLQQQAEVEALRNNFILGNTACYEMMIPDTIAEQIDHIPVEHVEVPATEAQLPADDLTVWSGWTQQHSVPFMMGSQANRTPSRPHTPLEEFPPVQGRPDIDDASVCAMPTNRRVRDLPLTMVAANGTVREALYSGSLIEGDQVTGVGVLKFPETGDLYCGEIVDGEMHGLGTYTFAASKKRKAGSRVLKGQFDHNVYVGWVVPHENTVSEI